MTAPRYHPEQARLPRDAAHWAQRVEMLKTPDGIVNPNVEGRRVVGPLRRLQRLDVVRPVGVVARLSLLPVGDFVPSWRVSPLLKGGCPHMASAARTASSSES